MGFSEIDWSVEKTHLKFDEHHDARIPLIRRRWASAPEAIRAVESSTLTSMHYSGETLARSFATPSPNGQLINLTLEYSPGVENVDFLRKSLIRVSLLRLEENISTHPTLIRLTNAFPSEADELNELGFTHEADSFFAKIDAREAMLRVSLKERLREYIKSAPKVGRGFLLDAEQLDHASVAALNKEYGDVAWGTTNWARHSTLSTDERKMIAKLPAGGAALEIGAGSGRVTEALVEKFNSITATDIVAETLAHVKRLGPNVESQMDDILDTKLKHDSYNVVMFWENGLGSLNGLASRRKALENMASLTRPGGLVVVAVRQLLPISVDHLMVAAQTDLVMGIYHTFSDEEMQSYAVNNLELLNVILGDDRPAGGVQKFFVYRKKMK